MNTRRYANVLLSTVMVLTLLPGCAYLRERTCKTPPEICPVGGVTCWTFEAEGDVGKVPTGWRIAETNPTKTLAIWKVIADDTAPCGKHAFALTESANYDGTYNLAIAENTAYQNLHCSVQVKAVTGEEDQGGGPIWRCQNRDNYYICRINPLESNYRVYVVRQGKRRQLDSARVELEAGRWYTLEISMIGDEIICSLDGKAMLHATDDTITAPGMIGLWTKADAVTSFDKLHVRPDRRE